MIVCMLGKSSSAQVVIKALLVVDVFWFSRPLTLDVIPLLLYLPSVISSQVLCTVVVFYFCNMVPFPLT